MVIQYRGITLVNNIKNMVTLKYGNSLENEYTDISHFQIRFDISALLEKKFPCGCKNYNIAPTILTLC